MSILSYCYLLHEAYISIKWIHCFSHFYHLLNWLLSIIFQACSQFYLLILILRCEIIMIESPIKRKHLNYPKDFLPNSRRQSTNSKRFALNQQYHIEATTIKKYEKGLQLDSPELKNSKYTQISINPQKLMMSGVEPNEQSPLDHHMNRKMPDINSQILKKPRFCIKKDDQIAQNDDLMQDSSSPGCIRHQLANRQIPLPLEDPCKIQLFRAYNSKNSKVPNQIIKFKALPHDSDKKWHSNQKTLLQKFKQSNHKRSLSQFPQLKNQGLNKSLNYSGGKQIFQNFQKNQQFQADKMGKINTFLSSLKMKDPSSLNKTQLPKFQASSAQRIKQEIHQLMLTKRKMINSKSKDNESENQSQPDQYEQEHKNRNITKNSKKAAANSNLPEYMVSYRSSLSFLKDLYTQTIDLQQYRLIVKIPKLFTQELIFKNQDKAQLYETARSIFSELRINHDNLIIKRYTNCIMIISRNVCMIWHFDGKRYLGGWQTQYLDQGCKHGLGLEWEPKSYVYYGEYAKNKKQGLGVYKDRSQNMFIGYWKKGKYINEKQQQNSKYGNEDNGSPYNQHPYSQENELQNNHSNYQYL